MNQIKVVDEVWIASALLHREHPEQIDFSLEEIVERARKAALTGRSLRAGVYVYALPALRGEPASQPWPLQDAF